MLGRLDYRVDFVANGLAVLAVTRQQHYGVVFMNVRIAKPIQDLQAAIERCAKTAAAHSRGQSPTAAAS
jgi:CheY-like chemotaxis protein